MRRALGSMGAFLGWLLWVLHVRRGVVMENLRLAFPDWTEERRRAVGRATFVNLGRMVPEFLFVTRLTPEELARTFVYDPGQPDGMLAVRATGRPIVVCTAHFGNFENLAAVHNLMGFPIAMLVRRLQGGWLGRLWSRGRERAGLEVLEVKRGRTLQAAIAAMRAGRVLGYVIDQNIPAHRAVFPTFFGVPASTAPTPAYLALRTGAAVFFALDVPMEDGRHRVVIEGPLEVPRTGDRERDVLAFMQDLNDRLERWIRIHPDRWYWLHRRWKTRPPPEGTGRRRRRAPASPSPIDPAGDGE
jgi:Kdo2-lipid IVA lauroyltransferase/acyltransferase